MDTKPLTIDGFLYAVPTPGTRPGTAQFELISSPTDDPGDDTVFACTTEESCIAYALLAALDRGQLLAARDTGTQVISTQALQPPRNPATIRQIEMPNVYAAP